jgi:putative phage-type endonuclease
MIQYKVEQNSDEWFALRRGKFTASTFKDLFMDENTRGYKNAIYKVAFERLTNTSPESFTNEYIQRGTELEPEARAWYEFEKNVEVIKAGFFEYNDWIGASPDGLVGDSGLIEIKCPKFSTMMDYLIKKELPKTHFHQVHGQLLITDRQWCDFIAYHPSLPKFVLRVEREKKIDDEILDKLFKAIKEVEQIITKLKG